MVVQRMCFDNMLHQCVCALALTLVLRLALMVEYSYTPIEKCPHQELNLRAWVAAAAARRLWPSCAMMSSS